jgi:hypothetical protein
MAGSRLGHGSSPISSWKACASGDQAERVKAHSSRARGGSRLRTEARRGPTTNFEGTSAGPSSAASSRQSPRGGRSRPGSKIPYERWFARAC